MGSLLTFFLSLLTTTSPLTVESSSKSFLAPSEIAQSSDASKKPFDFKRSLGGGGEGAPTMKQNTGKVRSEESYAGGRLGHSEGTRVPEATQSYSQPLSAAFRMPTPVSRYTDQNQQETSHASSPRNTSSAPSSYETGSSLSPEVAPTSSSGGSSGGTDYSASTSGSGSSLQAESEMTAPLTAEQMGEIKRLKENTRDPEEITVTPEQIAEVEAKFKKMEKELQQAKKESSIPVLTPSQVTNVPSVAPSQVTSVSGVVPSQVGAPPPPPPGFDTSPPPPPSQNPTQNKFKREVKTEQKKGSSSNTPVQGDTTSIELVKAAESIGFDLNASYKDEKEAQAAFKKALFAKKNFLDSKLDNPNISLEDYSKFANEQENLPSYEQAIKNYLGKKYDPNKEGVEAAQILGFDLNVIYKDKEEAEKVLNKICYIKETALEKELAKATPSSSEYNRLAKEYENLTTYKKSVINHLNRKYSTQKKKIGSLNLTGGDIKEQIKSLGKLQEEEEKATTSIEKELSVEEISKELSELQKSILSTERAYDKAKLSDNDEEMKNIDSKLKELKKFRADKIGLVNKLNTEEKEKKSGVKPTISSGHLVKTAQMIKEGQEKAVNEVKEKMPDLLRILELLEPKDQAKFLSYKMNLRYNPNTLKYVIDPAPKQVTKEKRENIVDILSQLNATQRNTLFEYLKGLSSDIRLSALAYAPYYVKALKYNFPDLEKPSSIVKTKSLPKTTTSQEGENPQSTTSLSSEGKQPEQMNQESEGNKLEQVEQEPEKELTLKEKMERVGKRLPTKKLETVKTSIIMEEIEKGKRFHEEQMEKEEQERLEQEKVVNKSVENLQHTPSLSSEKNEIKEPELPEEKKNQSIEAFLETVKKMGQEDLQEVETLENNELTVVSEEQKLEETKNKIQTLKLQIEEIGNEVNSENIENFSTLQFQKAKPFKADLKKLEKEEKLILENLKKEKENVFNLKSKIKKESMIDLKAAASEAGAYLFFKNKEVQEIEEKISELKKEHRNILQTFNLQEIRKSQLAQQEEQEKLEKLQLRMESVNSFISKANFEANQKEGDLSLLQVQYKKGLEEAVETIIETEGGYNTGMSGGGFIQAKDEDDEVSEEERQKLFPTFTNDDWDDQN